MSSNRQCQVNTILLYNTYIFHTVWTILYDLNHIIFSVSTNLNIPTRTFLRESSRPDAGIAMIGDLVNHLFQIEEELYKSIPKEIFEAINKLKDEIEASKFNKTKARKRSQLRELKKYLTLCCFGFNSGELGIDYTVYLSYHIGKYDIPTMVSLLYGHCSRNEIRFSTIKKGTKYLYLDMIKTDDREKVISLKDCLNYTSPCSLDKYCKQWGATLQKSLFPYTLYGSIEEMVQATEFPKYEDFYSSLKKV